MRSLIRIPHAFGNSAQRPDLSIRWVRLAPGGLHVIYGIAGRKAVLACSVNSFVRVAFGNQFFCPSPELCLLAFGRSGRLPERVGAFTDFVFFWVIGHGNSLPGWRLAAICSRAIVTLMWEVATAFKARPASIMLSAALQNFNRLCHF
jgi:hypothetical protein